VDGFFLDSLLGKFTRGPCYCKYCREAFHRDTGRDIPVSDGDSNVLAVHRWLSGSVARYAGRVTSALAAVKPDLAFVFTHVWVTHNPVKPPASVTQLVWEPVPPYPGVHSLDFSMEARYLSTQAGIVNWSCMATRGNGWGDYSLRDPEAFRHEAAVLLASSGRPYLSDDSYPSGNPDPAVYHVYGDVNRRTEELESIAKGSTPVKDVAVLLSANSIWSNLPLVPPRGWIGGPSSPAVAGAHTVLVETHTPFGILNSEGLIQELAEYNALIIADQCILGDQECEAIRRFVRAGGALIATAATGTRDAHNQPLADFALADVLGIQYLGQAEVRRAFLRSGAELAGFGIPRMDVQVNGAHPRVRTTTASQLLPLVSAAGGKQAPAAEPDGPAVTLNRFGRGKALYCALPVFRAYQLDGTSVLRKLAVWMLEQIYPAESRTLRLENAPVNVEVTYNMRGQDRLVHLLNYTGDKRMQGPQRLQGFSTVEGIRVHVRSDARPKRVRLVPEDRPVAFDWRDGWIRFDAKPLNIHSVYRIES
jgi:Beta-galactosidase trimerisation domain